MFNFSDKHYCQYFLVLLLLLAPFEVLFASNFSVTSNIDLVNDSTNITDDSFLSFFSHSDDHSNLHSSKRIGHGELGEYPNALNDNHADSDCNNVCPHCVFCNAGIIQHINTSSTYHEIYNPHISRLISNIYTDLVKQPPIV